jgi:hypothetical protein
MGCFFCAVYQPLTSKSPENQRFMGFERFVFSHSKSHKITPNIHLCIANALHITKKCVA